MRRCRIVAACGARIRCKKGGQVFIPCRLHAQAMSFSCRHVFANLSPSCAIPVVLLLPHRMYRQASKGQENDMEDRRPSRTRRAGSECTAARNP